MYRLIFTSPLDRLLHHRGVRKRRCSVWHPTQAAAQASAERLRALGQMVEIESIGIGVSAAGEAMQVRKSDKA